MLYAFFANIGEQSKRKMLMNDIVVLETKFGLRAIRLRDVGCTMDFVDSEFVPVKLKHSEDIILAYRRSARARGLIG